jgi:hypothetical protein
MIKYVVRNAENTNTVAEGKGGGGSNFSSISMHVLQRFLNVNLHTETDFEYNYYAVLANSHTSRKQPCIPHAAMHPTDSQDPANSDGSH